MPPIQFGKFRHSVEVKQFAEGRTPSGDFGPGELTVYARRIAAIETLRGREAVRARVMEADVSHIVRIHTDSVIVSATPDMQIHYPDAWLGKTRVFEILSVRQIDDENRITEFLCKEKVI